jgi:hypothetical protein
MDSAVAMKVIAVVITSSPGPIPAARRPRLRAEVPLETPIASEVPQ